jgi:predicted RND superfamily exporter protein
MFAGIAIGVGDDYAVHLWERLRRSLDRGEEIEAAIADSMADVGPGILVDALAVGAGFSVLILSRVPTDARLGALLVFAITGCLAASLTLLPPLFLRAGAHAAARRGSARSPARES